MAEGSSDPRLIAAQEALKVLLATSSLSCKMAEPLRPQHFITRQNGTMVPLVALDELPATVSLLGVPRTLSPYDVAGMKALGIVESQHRQYVIDGPKQGFQPDQKVVENGLLASKYATTKTKFDLESALRELELPHHAPKASTHEPLPKAYGIEEARPALPSLLRNPSARSTDPASRPLTIGDLARNPAPGVKEYCSYWLRHGECDYAQQGCLYRHEMPLDTPTLEKLGLRDIPRWYREKHGLGSYLALSAQRGTNGSTRPNLMERNWRNHPADVIPECTKTSVPSFTPRNGHTHNVPGPTTGTVSAWNAFAKNHSAAYNSPFRGSLNSPLPPAARQPFPSYNTPPSSSSSNSNNNIRPGARSVPANTETVSARILREANEQLDAHEERERAALQKYVPLVPHRTGTGPASRPASGPASGSSAAESESAFMTPPPSDPDTSSVELSTPDHGTAAAPPPPPAKNSNQNSKSSAPKGKANENLKSSPPATAAAVTGQPGTMRKRTAGRARARRGAGAGVGAVTGPATTADPLDREAQRKAVAKAKLQTEGLAVGRGSGSASGSGRGKLHHS